MILSLAMTVVLNASPAPRAAARLVLAEPQIEIVKNKPKKRTPEKAEQPAPEKAPEQAPPPQADAQRAAELEAKDKALAEKEEALQKQQEVQDAKKAQDAKAKAKQQKAIENLSKQLNQQWNNANGQLAGDE